MHMSFDSSSVCSSSCNFWESYGTFFLCVGKYVLARIVRSGFKIIKDYFSFSVLILTKKV